ncbi:MAG: hypothetical protein NTX50_24995 [Candidatus Sumerlaeota bacterium]|nr:hypothetical protein [Candidatus Sumerlaeota bacterium]
MEIKAGFLIVKTYARLYREYAPRYNLALPAYAIPRNDRGPDSFAIQYGGLDRNTLVPNPDSENLAEVRMADLEKDRLCEDDFLFTEEIARDALSYASAPLDFEIIWTRVAYSDISAPTGFISAGYEPTYFVGDHFSASCDCMLFPRWHGTGIDANSG